MNSSAPPATPKKIVYVSDSIYPYMKGGKEKRLHELTKRLALSGYDVHIYTMHWWKDPSSTTTQDGVQLHALSRYHELYHKGRRSIGESLLFAFACLKLLRVRFDVLDVDHMPFFPVITCWIICVLRRRRLHGTWHEALTREEWTSYMGVLGNIASFIERLCIKLPHVITAASAHTKSRLTSLHGRTTAGLVESGLDLDLIASIQPAPRQVDVLFIGRLVKGKHIDVLLHALKIIASQKPTVRGLIIGDGPERQTLEKLARRLHIDGSVEFMDPLPEAAEVYAYMKAAKVFCLPSDREGFGIVGLEALGCGTPVVTINATTNAARHLIQPDENGSIVPLDPLALSIALGKWTEQSKKLSNHAAIADYNWPRLAEKQVELYQV